MPTRLLVISNRAPYAVRRRGHTIELTRTIGGLSTALDDSLRRHGGVWLAWSGTVARARGRRRKPKSVTIAPPGAGYRLRLLHLDEQAVGQFYHGFSNRSLWPLCHFFIARTRFDADEWKSYESVNRLFARAASRLVPARGLTWVHDFHLALVPAMLRTSKPDAAIATFWHIPFPPPAVFRVNRRAREVVAGLLGSDLVGFHTAEYARHFLECARELVGARVNFDRDEIRHHGRTIRVGAFPLGVEAHEFGRLGSDRRVLAQAAEIRRSLGNHRLILGVDRLDYTKGILERLEAFERVLAEGPEFQEKICLVQIQVPSRTNVPEYRNLREQIDRTIGRICGRFSTPAWIPILYLCRSFSRPELAAYYRAADVMLVTPLRDGMNLVAQEFVATRADDDGVLVFSEFAGAAERLREAVMANPYDRSNLSEAIRTALHLKAAERHAAMRAMRKRVLTEDVDWWLEQYLSAAREAAKQARRARK